MKTYTFFGGSISPGFILTEDEKRGPTLTLGEYGPGSWSVWIPLNKNPENAPAVANNIVLDAFLFRPQVEDDQRPISILSRDRNQMGNSYLIRFRTECESGKGNGFVRRVFGFRSKALVGGHGRNSGITPTNGTWSDEIWVAHEGELLMVQLAGCDMAFAVRIRNGEPTVEPWIEREPRQSRQDKPGNGGNGKHQWRTLKGSHVDVQPSVWSPGIGEVEPEKTELDADLEEMARATGGRRAGTKTCRPGQLVAA